MTDKEMQQLIYSWVKESPERRLRFLKNWRKILKNDMKEGIFDPIHDVPTPGDNAYMLGHIDFGKIENIAGDSACITYEPTDYANHVPTNKLVKNEKENRWEYNEFDAERD